IDISRGVTISNTFTGNDPGTLLTLRADNTGTGVGTVAFNVGIQCDCSPGRIDFRGSSGSVAIYYNPSPPIDFVGRKYQHPTNFGPNVLTNTTDQLTTYMLVNNATDLQTVGTNLGGTYALGRDFDATSFTGFGPNAHFTGLLDGNGGLGTNSTISNLH